MPSIGLSMIVKNGGNDLRLCLSSVRSLVSQIVIVDTGSTDDSLAIAAEFGAQVIRRPWTDHFAEARNAALAPMNTDWILVLDADEELTEESAAAARDLVNRTPEDVGAYRVTIRNYTLEPYVLTLDNMSKRNTDTHERAKPARSYTQHQMTRLFRQHSRIFFTNRIHEQVDPQVFALGMRIEDANFLIYHYGNLKPSTEKRTYYRELGRKKLEETPESALAWFEAGGEEFMAGSHDKALRYLHTSLQLRPSAAAAYLIATIYCVQHEFAKSLTMIEQIPDGGDVGIGKLALKGEVLEGMGNLAEARETYLAALRLIQSVHGEGEYSLQTHIESRLGFVEVLLGQPGDGIPRMERAVAKLPTVFDLHDRLVKAWIMCGRDDLAAGAEENLLRYFANETHIARAAVLRLRSGNTARAEEILKKGLELIPDSERLRNLLGAADYGGSPISVESSASNGAVPS